jgi:hypothetical protein
MIRGLRIGVREMISLHLAVAVLGAAAVAGCITYCASPAPPQRIEADQRMPLTLPSAKDRLEPSGRSANIQPTSTEGDIAAYQRAAEAILKRAQNANASADEPPLATGHIPLPKPLPRP